MRKKIIIVTTVSDSLPFFKGQINVLKGCFDVELVSSSGKYLDEMCSIHEVKGHEINMKREISPIHDFLSLNKLIILFLKIRPDVVHGNTPKASLLSMIAAFITRVPKRIYYVHGLRYQGENGFKRKILMIFERVSCALATHVIAVSQGVKETIENDKIYNGNAHLIWNGSINGIDLDYFDPRYLDKQSLREEYTIKNSDFVFGFVGRFVKDKGVNELVRAFCYINKEFPKTKLLLVGRFESELDPLDDDVIVSIEENKNIINVGFQKDVRPFFSMMDVFSFPSYREGLCLVLMESSAMKIPAISTDIPGCKDVIEDLKNGFLIKSRNEQQLIEKMRYCIENPESIDNMKNNSRNFVKDKFEQKHLWQESLAFYKSLIN